MRKDFKDKVREWVNDGLHVGVRKALFQKNPYLAGEYILTLQQELKVSFGENTKVIKAEKKFQTFAQGESELNPLGDIIRLTQCLSSLALDFTNLHDEAINELFNGSGTVQEVLE